jgi:hypothetical protein
MSEKNGATVFEQCSEKLRDLNGCATIEGVAFVKGSSIGEIGFEFIIERDKALFEGDVVAGGTITSETANIIRPLDELSYDDLWNLRHSYVAGPPGLTVRGDTIARISYLECGGLTFEIPQLSLKELLCYDTSTVQRIVDADSCLNGVRG